jgi:hypothetical protein
MKNFLALLLLFTSTLTFANEAEDDFCRQVYSANKKQIDSLGIPSDVMEKEIATFQRTSLGKFKHYIACVNNLREFDYVNTRPIKINGLPIVEVAMRIRPGSKYPENTGKIVNFRFLNPGSNLSIHSFKDAKGRERKLTEDPILVTAAAASVLSPKESLVKEQNQDFKKSYEVDWHNDPTNFKSSN